MKSNELGLRKRVDVWRTYRDSIYKESSRVGINVQNHSKLNKWIKTINSIDNSILENINNSNFNLSSGSEAKIDFSSEYAALSFEFDKLDSSIINDLNSEILLTENIKKESNFINENGDFVYSTSEKTTKLDKMLKEIYSLIESFSERIKNFPKLAKDDLQILDQSLSLAKSKANEPLTNDHKVETNSYNAGKDLKIPYFISLIGLIVLLVIIVIVISLAFIL